MQLIKDPEFIRKFKFSKSNFEQIKKGVFSLLDSKRNAYGRLYFLSNNELIDIISD